MLFCQIARTFKMSIEHKELYKWIDKLTAKGYKVYLTSYESPLYLVKEYKHTSLLSPTNNHNVVERLYSNIKDNIQDTPKLKITTPTLF